jgi:hypothetical protein
VNTPAITAIRVDTFFIPKAKKKKKKTDACVRAYARLLYSPPPRRDDARVARLVSGAPALAGAVPANRDAGARRDALDLAPL